MFSPLCYPSSAFTQPPFTDSILWHNMGDFHLSAWRHFSNVAEWAGDLGKGWAELMHINPPANDKFPLRGVFVYFTFKTQSIILALLLDGVLGQKKRMLGNHRMKSRYMFYTDDIGSSIDNQGNLISVWVHDLSPPESPDPGRWANFFPVTKPLCRKNFKDA